MSKTYLRLILCLGILVLMTAKSFAATNSDDNVWREVNDSTLSKKPVERLINPSDYKTFSLNREALKSILDKAPLEFTDASRNNEPVILTLPMPDGRFARFRVESSPIMEAALAAKYPEIKTYRGFGIDDPTASVRFDLMPSGFHSMILSTKGTVLVDPYAKDDTENYISYFKKNVSPTENFYCAFDENNQFESLSKPSEFDPNAFFTEGSGVNVTSGTQLRTYRLALAATGEYTQAAGGGTVAGALAAQVLIMNRVNGVYERDVAIRMIIVANNDSIIYTDGSTDPYTNEDGGAMLSENINNINSVIGSANYDIGHVFSTGGGGVAFLSVPCGGSKAGGVTGLPNPVGDPFAIDYVAHEMGHQWGGRHTFNGVVSSCSGNRSASAAYEPGSGVTIMAYAGICGNQNLAKNSIDTFHVKSLEEIINYSQNGNGNSCAITTSTGNTLPTVTVTGGTSFNIPKQTPFALTASAADANNDPLTYDWEEYDLGASTTAVPNTDADGAARPIFRVYSPTTRETRTFPSLQYILNNANVPPSTTGNFLTGELLPAITRTMNFQVVVRDNRPEGGGINTARATVNVDGNSGPFAVIAPNTNVSWARKSQQTVAWNVNNTNNAPVNAANVKILLSTDGGQTFPTVLAASTPNDGSQTVTIPNTTTTDARIKVQGVDNIFFDISDVNFTITQNSEATTKPFFDFDGDRKADISIFRPNGGRWWYLSSFDNSARTVQFGISTDKIVPADYDGDDITDIAVFRPSSGQWFVLRSGDNSFSAFSFGLNGDVPVPADFDGDGKSDIAVFRPSNSTWYINNSLDGSVTYNTFGTNGDLPVAANYDGDNKTDIAIFRPSTGQWWINRTQAGLTAVSFGVSTDKLVPADYTGDGKTDIAVYRPSLGQWFVLRSEDSSFLAVSFGISSDSPTPGDYDGDGKTDFAVFRASSSTWYLQQSTSGFAASTFGTTGDIPVPNAYVR